MMGKPREEGVETRTLVVEGKPRGVANSYGRGLGGHDNWSANVRSTSAGGDGRGERTSTKTTDSTTRAMWCEKPE